MSTPLGEYLDTTFSILEFLIERSVELLAKIRGMIGDFVDRHHWISHWIFPYCGHHARIATKFSSEIFHFNWIISCELSFFTSNVKIIKWPIISSQSRASLLISPRLSDSDYDQGGPVNTLTTQALKIPQRPVRNAQKRIWSVLAKLILTYHHIMAVLKWKTTHTQKRTENESERNFEENKNFGHERG